MSLEPDNLCDKFMMGIYNESLATVTVAESKSQEVSSKMPLSLWQLSKNLLKDNLVSAFRHRKSRNISIPPKPPTNPKTHPPKQHTEPIQPCSWNSCGENHARTMYQLHNAKCLNSGKIGHIQRVCKSSSISFVQSNTSAESSNPSQQSTHFTNATQQSPADSAAISHLQKKFLKCFRYCNYHSLVEDSALW